MKKPVLATLLAALALTAVASGPVLAQETEAPTDAVPVEVTGVDYAYTGLPTSLPAGSVLSFANGGAEIHEMIVARVGDDVTETLDELLAMDQQGRDPVAEGLVEIINPEPLVAMPGTASEGTVALDREGRYVVLCFIPQGMDPAKLAEFGIDPSALGPDTDPSDFPPEALEFLDGLNNNPPHVALGMVQEFTVTAAGTEPGPLPEMDTEATEVDS